MHAHNTKDPRTLAKPTSHAMLKSSCQQIKEERIFALPIGPFFCLPI
jgi:hypothetical protein